MSDYFATRRAAQLAVAKALKSGVLVRQSACERCGGTNRVQGHHPDYSEPLRVEWLCIACHVVETRKSNAARPICLGCGRLITKMKMGDPAWARPYHGGWIHVGCGHRAAAHRKRQQRLAASQAA